MDADNVPGPRTRFTSKRPPTAAGQLKTVPGIAISRYREESSDEDYSPLPTSTIDNMIEIEQTESDFEEDVTEEETAEEEITKELNSHPKVWFFAPFLRQSHMLKKNEYNFADSPSKSFKKGVHKFKPSCSPENNWIKFTLEVANFLSTDRLDPLNPGQFASLLLDNVSTADYAHYLSRVSPRKVFAAYQAKYYSVGEAARDYKRSQANPLDTCRFGDEHLRYLTVLRSTPKGKALHALYHLRPEQLVCFQAALAVVFTPYGRLAIEEDDEASSRAIIERVLAIAEQAPQKSVQSKSRQKAKAPASPRADEWYKGKLRAECIKGWPVLEGVPRRTFQSFNFPGDKSTSRITDEEMIFRIHHNLCRWCGAHFAFEPHTTKTARNPFYRRYLAPRRTTSVSAGTGTQQ